MKIDFLLLTKVQLFGNTNGHALNDRNVVYVGPQYTLFEENFE